MSSAAESYERNLVPSLFSPWASVLLDVAQPQYGERLLDVACGTGVVARAAASMVSRQGTVSGLDLDEANIAVARHVAEQERLTISWHTGRAEELPFPDAGFDLVVWDQQHVTDELRADLAARLGPFFHDGVLVLPMHADLVTAAP